MQFKQHKMLRKALPAPKVFNYEFIYYEQSKLNQFRSQIRQLKYVLNFIMSEKRKRIALVCRRQRNNRFASNLWSFAFRNTACHIQIKSAYD
jgi:hypothetical protein